MLLTLECIAVVLASPLAVGIPVSRLLNARKPPGPIDWVRAPFLGVATIVVVLQNLVMLDVPVQKAAPYFWLAVLLAWGVCWCGGMLSTLLKQCPWSLLAAGLLVYLVQGFGLIHDGARSYLGRAWTDQAN